MTEEISVYRSSGNVFADIGLPNPEESLAKSKMMLNILGIIKSKNLTQAGAAKLLGIDQPKVSLLMNGKISHFSTDRLIRFLIALGRDIDLVIKQKPHSRDHGEFHVVSR